MPSRNDTTPSDRFPGAHVEVDFEEAGVSTDMVVLGVSTTEADEQPGSGLVQKDSSRSMLRRLVNKFRNPFQSRPLYCLMDLESWSIVFRFVEADAATLLNLAAVSTTFQSMVETLPQWRAMDPCYCYVPSDAMTSHLTNDDNQMKCRTDYVAYKKADRRLATLTVERRRNSTLKKVSNRVITFLFTWFVFLTVAAVNPVVAYLIGHSQVLDGDSRIGAVSFFAALAVTMCSAWVFYTHWERGVPLPLQRNYALLHFCQSMFAITCIIGLILGPCIALWAARLAAAEDIIDGPRMVPECGLGTLTVPAFLHFIDAAAWTLEAPDCILHSGLCFTLLTYNPAKLNVTAYNSKKGSLSKNCRFNETQSVSLVGSVEEWTPTPVLRTTRSFPYYSVECAWGHSWWNLPMWQERRIPQAEANAYDSAMGQRLYDDAESTLLNMLYAYCGIFSLGSIIVALCGVRHAWICAQIVTMLALFGLSGFVMIVVAILYFALDTGDWLQVDRDGAIVLCILGVFTAIPSTMLIILHVRRLYRVCCKGGVPHPSATALESDDNGFEGLE